MGPPVPNLEIINQSASAVFASYKNAVHELFLVIDNMINILKVKSVLVCFWFYLLEDHNYFESSYWEVG